MNCPVCSELMERTHTDPRGEWTRITYFCESCDSPYCRLITYKTQSSMVDNDEWEDLPEEDPMFEKGQVVFFVTLPVVARGVVSKRHVSEEGKFHYHVSARGAAATDFEFEEDQLYPTRADAKEKREERGSVT